MHTRLVWMIPIIAEWIKVLPIKKQGLLLSLVHVESCYCEAIAWLHRGDLVRDVMSPETLLRMSCAIRNLFFGTSFRTTQKPLTVPIHILY